MSESPTHERPVQQVSDTMMSRRTLVAGLLAAPVAACSTVQPASPVPDIESEAAGWYIGYAQDGANPTPIPLVDRSKMPPQFVRQVVAYTGPEKAGSVVVDIDGRFVYLVNGDSTAIRYGAGVGRRGFSWRGTAMIGRKAEWPDWRPTPTMLRIRPSLPTYLESGLDNPLGARAMYLYQEGRDILFRIHGTNEPWSIGEQVSSGCIRLLNEDVVDLYARVPVGTTVYVKRHGVYRV